MSTSIVLLVLALGWCAYLVVWWKDARKAAYSRTDAITTFTNGMGTLGGSASRSAGPLSVGSLELKPRTPGAAARRRQQVFAVLGSLAVLTLLASFVVGAAALLLHVVIDLGLVAYAYAVVQRRNVAAEREMKVQMLYPEGVTPMHNLRQTVNA